MPKLSIIIAWAGRDEERFRNLKECISCINCQSFKDYELIIVEQSLDNTFYKPKLGLDYNYVPIKDTYIRGFNLSWNHNVGAKIAKGDILVFMDADFIFDKNYFDILSKIQAKMFPGAKEYYYTMKWERYLKIKPNIFPIVGNTPSISSIGTGYGCIICYDRLWYLNEFGGYIENFFKWGWEDREGVNRAMKILNVTSKDIKRPDTVCVHLDHSILGRKANVNTNKAMYDKYNSFYPELIISNLKKINIGSLKSPSLLSI